MGGTQEFQQRVARIDGLVQRLESSADPALRGTARELIQALMELHGAGLERILDMVSGAGETGATLVQAMGGDELVSSLLVLYNLHPEDFETRVKRGLEKVRPLLRSLGTRVQLTAIEGDTVRLQVTAAADGAEAAIREALFDTAPDAAEVIGEGAKRAGQASGFVPLASLRSLDGSQAVGPAQRP